MASAQVFRTTCYNRFVLARGNCGTGYWRRSGSLRRRVQMIDNTAVQFISTRRTQKKPPGSLYGPLKGGLTTKVHALVDGRGLPLSSPDAGTGGRLPAAGCSRLRQGTILLADKAYDMMAAPPSVEGHRCLTQHPVNQPKMEGVRHKAPSSIITQSYRAFLQPIKRFRRIATRYEARVKLSASSKLAAAQIWMRQNESMALVLLTSGSHGKHRDVIKMPTEGAS